MTHRIMPRLIQESMALSFARRLPGVGEITVKTGDRVNSNDTIGQITTPGRFVIVDIAADLGVQIYDADEVLQKQINDSVEAGEAIAQLSGKPAIFKRVCKAPTAGRIAAIEGGRALIETDSRIEKIRALVSGAIAAVDHTRGVTIETVGAYIEASFSLGPDGIGLLVSASDDPTANMNGEGFDVLQTQTIFMAGGSVDEATIRMAEEVGIAGVIVGSIATNLLKMDPPPKIPVIATEGFGNKPMDAKTYQLLKTHLNSEVTLYTWPAKQSGRSIKRPAIIIPKPPGQTSAAEANAKIPDGYAGKGSWVRKSRDLTSSEWGQIIATPNAPRPTDADINYYGAEVKFPQETQFVPWHNLEHLG